MNVYKVTFRGIERYCGTEADVKTLKKEYIELNDLPARTDEIEWERAEIPTSKAELIEFVNELCERFDPSDAEEPDAPSGRQRAAVSDDGDMHARLADKLQEAVDILRGE